MTKNPFEVLTHACVQVIPEQDFEKKLVSGKKLIIKFGIDPTAPDLHLGHAVVLAKLREFQDLGHTIIFLIGDFTARIGDPTGRSKTRPPLTKEQIVQNVQTYLDQVGRVLDIKKITVKFNADWFEEFTADDFVKLCSKMTVARILERDDFQKRLQDKIPIGLHELLYPVLQAYDSVALKADVELGGTDQTFNLLCGRFLQEQYGQEPQVVMTMPLLEGLDGVQKMSKSYGNTIGLIELPDQVFGKIMSLSDVLMWRYYQLLLGKTADDIVQLKKLDQPKECKKQLAHAILSKFWSSAEADAAQKTFEAVFEQKDYSQAQKVALPEQNILWIVDLLKYLQAIDSSSQAKRLIESGAVLIDEKPVIDFKAQISPVSGMSVKVGKHRIFVFE